MALAQQVGFSAGKPVRWIKLMTGLITIVCTTAAAQTPQVMPPRADCPPVIAGVPPTVGGTADPSLSDRLADSRGVICPPAGIDPEIKVPAPGGGEIRILPAPGTPGSDPRLQPK
jgi:hypothetical protein